MAQGAGYVGTLTSHGQLCGALVVSGIAEISSVVVMVTLVDGEDPLVSLRYYCDFLAWPQLRSVLK